MNATRLRWLVGTLVALAIVGTAELAGFDLLFRSILRRALP